MYCSPPSHQSEEPFSISSYSCDGIAFITPTKTNIPKNANENPIAETYDERVMSRLIGNYVVCKFFGDDIRLKKKKMGE